MGSLNESLLVTHPQEYISPSFEEPAGHKEEITEL